MDFFAHDSPVPHTEPAVTDNAPSFVVPADAAVAVLVVVVLGAFWVIATRALKWSLASRLAVVMVTLLITGVLGFQTAPITSIVAIAGGFALALANVLIQLAKKTHGS
ncbi:MAG TPA: hypothetical protein VFO38_04095 [Candidatus Saccharimonadales bacterium]|nr:hypothetical protein [Candidatus Saccharimonadales bacterium]